LEAEVTGSAQTLEELTIARAGFLIRSRNASPMELTEEYLRRIRLLNSRLNAFVTVTEERARSDARRATREIDRGEDRGLLHGIPIALKDLFETSGILTTAGSKILRSWTPRADSTVARRLREAGTVLLGKLGMDEFAMGGRLAGSGHNGERYGR
jgi:aspartyl-tRNA(Asn)/glutamyl-tRNA(Gln) amidotransferase subunit A